MFHCCRGFTLYPATGQASTYVKDDPNTHPESKLRVFLPDCLAGVRVGVLAAAAEGHVVVAQQVGGTRGPLAQPQNALVYFKHVVIEELVQDGCRWRNTGTHLVPVKTPELDVLEIWFTSSSLEYKSVYKSVYARPLMCLTSHWHTPAALMRLMG